MEICENWKILLSIEKVLGIRSSKEVGKCPYCDKIHLL